MSALQHALKEWAVICRALAEGRQALLLRKGGIAEKSGQFEVEQRRFWLFPTFVHQQKDGIVPEGVPLLEQAKADRPPPGLLRLTHYAETTNIYYLHDLAEAEKLAGMHCWSRQTVQSRFDYRRLGLHALVVRVYRAGQAFELHETSEYAGCRSWVTLERALPTEAAMPVLSDEAFADLVRRVDVLFSEPRP